jgi:hypothetical protein
MAPGSDAGSVPLRITPASRSTDGVHDPLANLRESERRHEVFDYRPELADPDKLSYRKIAADCEGRDDPSENISNRRVPNRLRQALST